MINKINNNKVIQTSDVFRTIKEIKKANSLIITPLTKVENIFSFSTNNLIFKMLNEKYPNVAEEIIAKEKIFEIINELNQEIKEELIDFDFSHDKLIKSFFHINKEIKIEKVINFIFDLYNQYSLKVINIYLIGFDEYLKKEILNENKNINLIAITNNFKNIIGWNNIEQLIIHKEQEFIEIHDENMLLSYLEHELKTPLKLQDLNNYFNDDNSFNSFLIDRAIRNI